jgi:hypothetical protein
LVTSPKLDTTPAKTASAKAIPAIFLGCAAIDFIWGYIHERSFVAGVVAIGFRSVWHGVVSVSIRRLEKGRLT